MQLARAQVRVRGDDVQLSPLDLDGGAPEDRERLTRVRVGLTSTGPPIGWLDPDRRVHFDGAQIALLAVARLLERDR